MDPSAVMVENASFFAVVTESQCACSRQPQVKQRPYLRIVYLSGLLILQINLCPNFGYIVQLFDKRRRCPYTHDKRAPAKNGFQARSPYAPADCRRNGH